MLLQLQIGKPHLCNSAVKLPGCSLLKFEPRACRLNPACISFVTTVVRKLCASITSGLSHCRATICLIVVVLRNTSVILPLSAQLLMMHGICYSPGLATRMCSQSQHVHTTAAVWSPGPAWNVSRHMRATVNNMEGRRCSTFGIASQQASIRRLQPKCHAAADDSQGTSPWPCGERTVFALYADLPGAITRFDELSKRPSAIHRGGIASISSIGNPIFCLLQHYLMQCINVRQCVMSLEKCLNMLELHHK